MRNRLRPAGAHVFLVFFLFPAIIGASACSEPTGPSPNSVLLVVNGTIQDSVRRLLSGVRVEVTSGADAGKFAVSDANGNFTLSANVLPSTALQIRASKAGYTTVTRSIPVTANPVSAFLSMTSIVLIDLSGMNTMTVTAADSCSASLPSLARSRTYPVQVSGPPPGAPSFFQLFLTNRVFFQNTGSMSANVAADFVAFFVFAGEDIPLVEEVGPDAFVMFYGTASAAASPGDAVIDAVFNGTISYCPAQPSASFVCPVEPPSCYSPSHRLRLSRN